MKHRNIGVLSWVFIISSVFFCQSSLDAIGQSKKGFVQTDTVYVEIHDTVIVHDTVWIKDGIMYGYNPEPYRPPVVADKKKDSLAALVRKDHPDAVDAINDNRFRDMVDSMFTAELEFNRDSLVSVILANDEFFKNDWRTTEVHYSTSDFSKLPKHLRFELLRGNERYRYNWYGSLTWGYGPRWGKVHKGLDTFLEMGDSLFATFNGIVRYAEFNPGGYGNCVVIRHFNGLETLYGHMSKLNVKPGQLLETGDLIGLAGSTGRSDGPHLHFETRYQSYSFDPLLILNKDSSLALLDTVVVLDKDKMLNDGQTGRGTAINYVKDNLSQQGKYHVVKKGDTLHSIAKKHRTTVQSLMKLNKLKNANQIRIGQQLRIK
ncbi:MAG: peptidoglycan DD-metalloendopeptidase family protein [Bacteroidota bacterium]